MNYELGTNRGKDRRFDNVGVAPAGLQRDFVPPFIINSEYAGGQFSKFYSAGIGAMEPRELYSP
jgi:hypothetical protein